MFKILNRELKLFYLLSFPYFYRNLILFIKSVDDSITQKSYFHQIWRLFQEWSIWIYRLWHEWTNEQTNKYIKPLWEVLGDLPQEISSFTPKQRTWNQGKRFLWLCQGSMTPVLRQHREYEECFKYKIQVKGHKKKSPLVMEEMPLSWKDSSVRRSQLPRTRWPTSDGSSDGSHTAPKSLHLPKMWPLVWTAQC